jgi:hypothetical protein
MAQYGATDVALVAIQRHGQYVPAVERACGVLLLMQPGERACALRVHAQRLPAPRVRAADCG